MPYSILHHSRFDPRTHVGGVESFARNLEFIFEHVDYSTPESMDPDRVRERAPVVICDNHYVLDWPEDIPVIGFQHGVAEVRARITGYQEEIEMGERQAAAARRPNTRWVACAEWISRYFGKHYNNAAREIVYHPIDTKVFDGRLDNDSSRLILHDARSEHKGAELIPILVNAFPDWRFEPLDCPADQVAERLRAAAGFIHLSRYEGNSIVCNEAMAMNLPCLFTRVGLMLEAMEPFDVSLIEAGDAFNSDSSILLDHVSDFLEGLGRKSYNPRRWILENATPTHAMASWTRFLA